MTIGLTCGRARTGILMILLGALIVFPHSAPAQSYRFSPNCSRAWTSILNFEFSRAQAFLALEKRQDPGNLLPVSIENYIDFLKLFPGEDAALYEALKPGRDKRLALLRDHPVVSPWSAYCEADICLQWGFARLKFKDYTAAALDMKRAYDLLKRNQERYPGFLPNRLGLGLLHAMIGVIPENYRWISKLIGLTGSVDQGIAELDEIARSAARDPYVAALKPLAYLFEALIRANLGNDKRAALDVLRRFDLDPLMEPYRDSPAVAYVKSSIYLKTGKNPEALALLVPYAPSTEAAPLTFLYYLKGIALLNTLDPSSAHAFRKYLEEFRGVNYVKSSYQKLAWNSLLAGDSAGYRRYMKQALTRGEKNTDEDKQAYQEAKTGAMPGVPLLRARLLFDGGYYRQADEILLNLSLKEYIRDHGDLAEYYYRLGRIAQESGNPGKAERYYRQAISTGRDLPQYFAAGAAFQLGLMKETAGNFKEASAQYRLCISLPNVEYKASLDQKARAGLNRIAPHK